MKIIPSLIQELENEAVITRKMLSRIPEDKYDWQPHPKSMTIRRLAAHIAELPGWVAIALTTNELDFAAGDYKPVTLNNNDELLAHLEASLAIGKAELEKADEAILDEPWTMRNGETILDIRPKGGVIRMSYSQIVHHRAQLGVFLRLLDVPIPASYGPSADEH